MDIIKFLIAIALFGGAIFYLIRRIRYDYRRAKSKKIYKNNPTIPDVIKNMTGEDFEFWIQGLFLKIGIDAEVVGGQGDHGIDLIVKHDGKKIAVQCKKYYKIIG